MAIIFILFGKNSSIYTINDINSPFKQDRATILAHYNNVCHI